MANNSVRVVRFDWAIKNILRNKANFDILEGFLSALLRENVSVVNIIESESNKEREEYKFNKVDLLVLDAKKRKIIIEIQNASETDFMDRLIWGASKVITESIEKGQNYKNIVKVISISIVYFNIMSGSDYIYKAYTTIEPQKYQEFIVREREAVSWYYNKEDKFPEYYILDLTKYKNELESDIDEWIYMLKNSEIRDDFKSKNINKARIKLNELKMTVEEMRVYEKYMEEQVVLRDNIETARREGLEAGIAEGIETGLDRGRKEGMKEGMKKGMKEGMKEGMNKLARNMLKGNFDVHVIAEMTGLSVDEINLIGSIVVNDE
ncbi:MAG: hypothetical protein A2Y24_02050 [Clostridiales bacterium GWE2_32_10]|nr:MAG: hypothetical protein A2Y24_02050 [Clostridiales bacterium GWE2_32_10]